MSTSRVPRPRVARSRSAAYLLVVGLVCGFQPGGLRADGAGDGEGATRDTDESPAAGAETEEAAPASPAELAAIFARARRLRARQEWDESNAAYREYLERLPKADSSIDIRRARAHYDLALNALQAARREDAFAQIGEAIEHGYWNPALLESDPALAPVRGTPELRALVERCRSAPGRMVFGLPDLDGEIVDAKDYEGKVLVLNVWGTWCPHCREEIPALIELQDTFEEDGLRVIGVTFERVRPSDAIRRQVRAFAERREIDYRCVVVDSELVGNVPITGYPTTILVDHTGRVVRKLRGKQSFATLSREVGRLLERKERAERVERARARARSRAESPSSRE